MTAKQRNGRAVQNKKNAIARGRTREGSRRACVDCPALCCHDLAIEILRPRLREDIDNLKWHLHFDTVHVAIRHRQWYLVVNGRCIYLDENNLCTIYDRRPDTCRDHNPPDCEKYGLWYHVWIETPDELEDYLKGRWKKRQRSSPHCSRGRLLGRNRGTRGNS
jgi:Fe-S-cluster containining protein